MQTSPQAAFHVKIKRADNVHYYNENCDVKVEHADNVSCHYEHCIFLGKDLLHPARTLSENDKIFLKTVRRLKRNYEKDDMPSLLWHDDSKDLPLEKYFVPLTVDEDHLLGKFSIGQSIQLDKIFFTEDKDGKKRRKRRILIRGDPGYGKSTLIRKLAYDWATLILPHYLEIFDIVVIISVKNLGDRTIKEAVLNEMSRNNMESLNQVLQESALRFLLLLDGYDEAIETDKVLKFLKDEEDEEFFLDVTVVVTSRPQAVDNIWKEFDRCLSVLGFSKENQILYIKEVLGHQGKKMENILVKLNNNQFLSDLSKCPLMLHMFCCLESETDANTLSTLTGLYIQLITLLIARYTRKHNNLDISANEKGEYFVGETLILELGKLASCYFRRNSGGLPITAISEDDLHKTFPDANDFRFVTGLDILIPVASTNGSSKHLSYDFMHRTIAEFLTIFYIIKLPIPQLNVHFSELIFLSNNLSEKCFFFGLMRSKILECEYILESLTNKLWEADWIDRFKEEISQETWDKFLLRGYIKKLSCATHNFTKKSIWFSLHQNLDEMVANLNPNVENWDDVRTEILDVIRSCEYLKSLTISFCPCSRFQVMYDNIGTGLLINMSFLMDDLIKIYALNFKKFRINIIDFNLQSTLNTDLTVNCDQAFGLSSNVMPPGDDIIALWNIGKMELVVSFKREKGNTRNVMRVVLLLSQEQYNTLTQSPFSYPKRNTEEYVVKVEGRTIISVNSV